jgi:hypothetical protein
VNGLESGWREDDGAVSVGLKVNTDIETSGSVVQMLDTSRSTDYLQAQVLLNVCCRGTVSVCSLDDTNGKLVHQTGLTSEFGDKRSSKGSDTVTVQESEDVLLVLEVEDDTVSITIQRTTAISRTSLG